MHTPSSNAQPFDALAQLLAASLQAYPAPAPPVPYPVSFADLVYATVTGDPSPMQLQSAETHFRDLNRMEDGAAALRQLRSVTDRHGRYPTLAFAPDSVAVPLLTVARPPGVLLSDADEALRAAVTDVSQMQLRLVSHQYLSLLAGTMANAHRHLIPGVWTGGDLGGIAALQGTQDAMSQAAATLEPPLQVLSAAMDAPHAGPSNLGGGPIRSARQRTHPARFEPYGNDHIPIPSYLEAQRTANRPLGGLIQYWIGRADAELAARWNNIDEQARGTDATSRTLAFKKFLLGLMYTPIHRLDATRNEVTQWLIQAAAPDRAAFRAEAFRICGEGTTMCRDNALLTWNRLKMLMCKADALDGRYAGKLDELCRLALDSLRWETLEAIGQGKIMAMHKENQQRRDAGFPLINIDPVEIMLHYHVELAEELHLPLAVKEMVFPTLSALTAQDIQNARDAIKRVETEAYGKYLMLEFTPFLAEVQRQIGPDNCRKAEATLYASLDGFDERVRQRLQDLKLPIGDDPLAEDARRDMGIRVNAEIRYSAWLPYANAVLAAAGMATLPALDIPPRPGPSAPQIPPAAAEEEAEAEAGMPYLRRLLSQNEP